MDSRMDMHFHENNNSSARHMVSAGLLTSCASLSSRVGMFVFGLAASIVLKQLLKFDFVRFQKQTPGQITAARTGRRGK